MDNLIKLPLPNNVLRMETGPVAFGNDWPGVFIRGDNAFAFAMVIDEAITKGNLDWITERTLIGLKNTLHSCIEGNYTPE